MITTSSKINVFTLRASNGFKTSENNSLRSYDIDLSIERLISFVSQRSNSKTSYFLKNCQMLTKVQNFVPEKVVNKVYRSTIRCFPHKVRSISYPEMDSNRNLNA